MAPCSIHLETKLMHLPGHVGGINQGKVLAGCGGHISPGGLQVRVWRSRFSYRDINPTMSCRPVPINDVFLKGVRCLDNCLLEDGFVDPMELVSCASDYNNSPDNK